MSSRKVMQAPNVRRGIQTNRPQMRSIWDLVFGGYWRGG